MCAKARVARYLMRTTSREAVRVRTFPAAGVRTRRGGFPALLSQMARVGEETGTLEENLATLADFYEEAVDRSAQIIVSLTEPILTIFIAAVVGFIAVSMVMPMYSILSEIE